MTSEQALINFAVAVGTDIKNLIVKTDTFIFTQSTPSQIWIINHNLNRFPSVAVVDSAGTLVEGSVEYNDANRITLMFVGGFSGRAYLN